MLDALIVMWSSICLRVDSIEASRVNDLSPFGPTVMVGQGVGTTVEQFEKGVADGSIVGHIGFPESIELIARALNWKIDEIVETREPIVTEVERSTPHVHVPAGWVAGCKQVGKGYVKGELKIHLIHPQQIHPEMADQGTGDYIKIVGDPNVNMVNSPEIPGGKGTYASTGNYIPLMKDAKPGMLTVVDMPLPRFWTPTALRGVIRVTDQIRAREGDWVEVECKLLDPADRSKNLPPETAEKPLMMWVKGFALGAAAEREELTIETITGRKVTGAALCREPRLLHHLRRPDPGADARGPRPASPARGLPASGSRPGPARRPKAVSADGHQVRRHHGAPRRDHAQGAGHGLQRVRAEPHRLRLRAHDDGARLQPRRHRRHPDDWPASAARRCSSSGTSPTSCAA